MPSYGHKKIIERVLHIDNVPEDALSYHEWIKAEQHLNFLEDNALSPEIAIYCSNDYTFIHSMIVANALLTPPDQNDLSQWSGNPYTSAASYAYGGGRNEVWIEREASHLGSTTLDGAKHIIYGRTFEGWSGDNGCYFELNQEISHLLGVHWRQEHKAYCKYDDSGDLDHVLSITDRNSNDNGMSLVSCRWSSLETYLAVSDCSLVRLFDFTLLRHGSFPGWPAGPEENIVRSQDFFFRQKNAGNSAYTRGVQIVRIRQNAQDIMDDIKRGWGGESRATQYVEFIAQDWRHKQIRTISTDPNSTTNYFEAGKNDLPFELSPAFFKPEVLLKYKSDKDKYEIGEREITCRAAWYLRGFDVNEAGQVHAYICDLRKLPYSEQLHWRSYNVEPEAEISKRAFTNDFEGEFVSFQHPLRVLLSIIERWREAKVLWWKLRDSKLPQRTSAPITASVDEWAESFMDLSKLINEGFETNVIRNRLHEISVKADASTRSLGLLECLLLNHGVLLAGEKLEGLRTVQRIRSKVKGHSGSGEAKEIVRNAIERHESLSQHFKYVCCIVVKELEIIEAAFLNSKPQ